MNLSTKLLKFLEGMRVFETLLDDERDIFPLFGLCFTITAKTVLGQQDEYKRNLLLGKLLELLDYNVDEVSNPHNYTGTGKLQYEMYRYGDKKIIDVLYEIFGEMLNGTFKELYDDYLLEYIKQIASNARENMDQQKEAAPEIYENNFPNLMNRHNWSELEYKYQEDKKTQIVTMGWLQQKQERELQKVLELDIMHYADDPSAQAIEESDFQYHRRFLSHRFKETPDYIAAYTKFMQYATRQEGMIIPKLGEYGKYIATHINEFRPEQKLEVFAIIRRFELIHKDMVRLNPELGKYIGIVQENLESLENTKYFAPYFHIKEMLKGVWFKKLRTDTKYSDKWADAFAEALIRSEYGLQIVNDWSDKGNQIKGYVIGCLKEAGVFKDDVSNDCIARDAGIMTNTRTFGKYIGKDSQEQSYAKWIRDHVNDYC